MTDLRSGDKVEFIDNRGRQRRGCVRQLIPAPAQQIAVVVKIEGTEDMVLLDPVALTKVSVIELLSEISADGRSTLSLPPAEGRTTA